MTLDRTSFRLQQPRVISVHSYYLTSLVNLAFCRLDVTFNWFRNTFQNTTILHSLSVNHLCAGIFPLNGKVHLYGALRINWWHFEAVSDFFRFVITNLCPYSINLLSICFFSAYFAYWSTPLRKINCSKNTRQKIRCRMGFITCTLVSPFLTIRYHTGRLFSRWDVA